MKPTSPASPERRAQLQAELRRDTAERQKGYREQALRILPHVCASCGRSFEGKRLKELTVHHRDHNHNNNPPDGSNWELLCIYCHDHEHEKTLLGGYYEGARAQKDTLKPSIFEQFSVLDSLLPQSPAADDENDADTPEDTP
ncbi:MAG: YajD family HNH nuclease [Kiritimatiellae bacterium]|jgi:5-methylcytosine-specific restriction endonuclease McrA|nr:YajD family HNH nuclease [Kiritimatiellia bacterium]MDD2346933.1 YajD family HNH nuclease [Kiritimatiellia bacterium]MDD3584612.1 YajD family HNH nuclease [Kiritimatiellia bacterium]HHU14293.1 HNH nuclease family protein [Lentisphaerota bacterium]HON47017.1 YajD family HNH nuclease [Kiritimatiellia bacterium]